MQSARSLTSTASPPTTCYCHSDNNNNNDYTYYTQVLPTAMHTDSTAIMMAIMVMNLQPQTLGGATTEPSAHPRRSMHPPNNRNCSRYLNPRAIQDDSTSPRIKGLMKCWTCPTLESRLLWDIDWGRAGGPEHTAQREQIIPKGMALCQELDMSDSLLKTL